MKYTDVISEIKTKNKPVIIMISGFGGAGKSTYSRKLAKELSAPIIGIDSFFKSLEFDKFHLWNSIDYKRFEEEVLKPFIKGSKSISYGEFDWLEKCINKTLSVSASDYIIVEGIGLFRPELMKYYTYKIWIDCPIDVAIERGSRRDRLEYGVNHDYLWNGVWKDNDLECYEVYKPDEIADCLIQYEIGDNTISL